MRFTRCKIFSAKTRKTLGRMGRLVTLPKGDVGDQYIIFKHTL